MCKQIDPKRRRGFVRASVDVERAGSWLTHDGRVRQRGRLGDEPLESQGSPEELWVSRALVDSQLCVGIAADTMAEHQALGHQASRPSAVRRSARRGLIVGVVEHLCRLGKGCHDARGTVVPLYQVK